MAVTNYGTLKTEVATWLARSNMTAMIPGFIAMTHNKLMRGDEVGEGFGSVTIPAVRLDNMLTEDALTLSDGAAALPDDYLEAKRLFIDADSIGNLTYRPPEIFRSLREYNQAGVPRFYTIEGSNLLVAPHGGYDVALLYYAALPALDADADTNVIIARKYETYLYGALAEAYDYLRNHERASHFYRKCAGAASSLNDASDRGQMSGGELVMIPDRIA